MSTFEQASTSVDSHPLRDWLRFAMVPGVGPLMRRDLLARFGGVERIFSATQAELCEVPRLGRKLSQAICQARETIDPQAEIDRCQAQQIDILPLWHPDFPSLLREIPDPPAVLFVHGELLPQDRLAVAIVGTRHATSYGTEQTRVLATSLARAGVTVISGLARGIDATAHRAALDAGGRTIAVLGCGLANIYPAEHRGLADQIAKQGAVLTESPSYSKPLPGTFPRRNRLISGLSHGLVVVEAGDRSGALNSAHHAMEQGREVFAVPGRVNSRMSKGCHRLIRDGAKLVETADDVLEELGPLFEAVIDKQGHEIHRPAELQLNSQERVILDAIDTEPTSMDDIVARCGIPIHRVLATISVLEVRRCVRRLSGTFVART